MPDFTSTIPLTLYVHIPWCVRKCPYCDFNSHAAKDALPQELYVNALLQELDLHAPLLKNRTLSSIFFGGGTPSLFAPTMIARILDGIAQRMALIPDIEITLEANPGTVDQAHFVDFRHAGINRLSLGLQSLQNDKLQALGRIHDREQAMRAITVAQNAGFSNFNLDLMYGLPNQTIDDALADIRAALTFAPTHLSWYQLTIEPNTLFHHQPPVLPADETIWAMQLAGQQLLCEQGLQQYEVSAYARAAALQCRHNLNYWQFGDYLGIGAGAHSKITTTENITRFAQVKQPRDYLARAQHPLAVKTLTEKDSIFEFMLNALRLTQGVPITLFTQRTGLDMGRIEPLLAQAKQRGLLLNDAAIMRPTELGRRFLNDLMQMFL
jgi:oxygen-independent coproporphyrinogen-3 oxidase